MTFKGKRGKWMTHFIRIHLVIIFSAYSHEKHIQELLTKVMSRLSERPYPVEGYVQVSEKRDTLRKTLYFLPGYV